MAIGALNKCKSFNPRRTAAKWLLKKSIAMAYTRGSVMLSTVAAGAGMSLWTPSYKKFEIPFARAGIIAGLSILLPVLRSIFRLKTALGLIR